MPPKSASGPPWPAARAEGAALQLDPRSYSAKSVPQRMAIISAGVIMNLIFAVIMATIAYSLGVKVNPCAISGVLPGQAAWRADLRPGDRIIKIGDKTGDKSDEEPLRYSDLVNAVMFSDPQQGVKFEIQRDGVREPFWLTIHPDVNENERLRPTIGVTPASTNTLYDEKPVVLGSVAAQTGNFKGGDRITAIGGVPTPDYAAFVEQLTRNTDKPAEFTVERRVRDAKKNLVTPEQYESPQTFVVPPQPRRVLGLEMELGKITAVQDNSPAAKAGLQPGDFIAEVDGEAPGDPLTLPDRLRQMAGETITIKIARSHQGQPEEKLTKSVTLRNPEWYEESLGPGHAGLCAGSGHRLSSAQCRACHSAQRPGGASFAEKGQRAGPFTAFRARRSNRQGRVLAGGR